MSETLHWIRTRRTLSADDGVRTLWYNSSSSDLWVRKVDQVGGDVLGFDLTYEPNGRRRAAHVRWRRGAGVQTGEVDTGESPGEAKGSPVLHAHPTADAGVVIDALKLLENPQHRVPGRILRFVVEKLQRSTALRRRT